MTTPCLYSVGDRVRLANPDNPRHPARGKAGVVIATSYRDPTFYRYRDRKSGLDVIREKAPGAWFVEVLFRRSTAEEWRRFRTISELWILLETELEPVNDVRKPVCRDRGGWISDSRGPG